MSDKKTYPFFDKSIIDVKLCKTHPFGFVGMDKERNWFKKCFIGQKREYDVCKIVDNSFSL